MKHKEWKYTFYVKYIVLFVVISMVGFAPFLKEGKTLVWEIDGIGQYYQVFLYIGKWLREVLYGFINGKFSIPMFDISIGMGEDVIGCLNYYGFGDPINILSVFATQVNGPYIFTAMFFLRLFLAGLFFCHYCIYMKLDRSLSIAGAMAYVFSGFALCGGARYIEFLSAMVYLPLMLLGCEKILKKEKSYLFTFVVTFAAMCNFYFLYMVSVFWGIYCITRGVFLFKKSEWKIMLKKWLVCIGQYILGIGIAAPILIPSISGFIVSARTELNITDIIFNIDNWLPKYNLLCDFFKGYQCGTGINYWSCVPILEIITLFITILLPKTKRNMQCMIAVGLGILAWCIPITSYAASGFGNNYVRWVFILQFVFSVVMVYVLEEVWKSVILLFNQYKNVAVVVKYVAILSVVVNIVFNVFYLNVPEGKNWSAKFLNYDAVRECTDSPLNYSKIQKENITRVSNSQLTEVNGRPENVAMINDYNGLTFWFSIVNENVQNFVNQLGDTKRDYWRSYGLNHSCIYESLAGVKYYLQSNNEAVPYGYKIVDSVPFNGEEWSIYENEHVLPLGYTYEETIAEKEYSKLNLVEKMDVLTKRIVLENGERKSSNDSLLTVSDAEIDREGNVVKIQYNILPQSEVYLFVKENSANALIQNVIVQERNAEKYKVSADEDVLYGLGSNFENDTITVEIDCEGIENDSVEEAINNLYIYNLDGEKAKSVLEERRSESLENISIEGNTISGKLEVSRDKYLVMAVPYSINWKAYLDGEEVPIYKANIMYMGIEVGKGVHEVSFVYRPIGWWIGLIMGMISIVVIVVIEKSSLWKKLRQT